MSNTFYRRIQSQMEAEERKQERIKWVRGISLTNDCVYNPSVHMLYIVCTQQKHQEREQEDKEARARYLRSESEEKAAVSCETRIPYLLISPKFPRFCLQLSYLPAIQLNQTVKPRQIEIKSFLIQSL